jgi:hypothetical protein
MQQQEQQNVAGNFGSKMSCFLAVALEGGKDANWRGKKNASNSLRAGIQQTKWTCPRRVPYSVLSLHSTFEFQLTGVVCTLRARGVVMLLPSHFVKTSDLRAIESVGF